MKSLYGKLFIAFLISLIISFSIAGYFGIQKQSERIYEMVIQDCDRIHNLVLESIKYEDEALIANIISSADCQLFYEHNNQIHVYGIDEKQASETIDFVNNQTNFVQNKNYEQMYQNGRVYVVKKQMNNTTFYYHFNMSQEHALYENAVLFAFVGIFVIGSFIFLIVADILVKPIKRLTKATNSVAHGNYDVQVNYYGKDEIAALSNSFNLMAKRLVKSEENRQKFISDVSHEFQTPLTSIQGFAKILTAEQLNDDQRRRYGGIILEQSIRLSTLSKNMMQLTLLEGDDLELNKEKYSLIEQLQRVIDMQQGFAAEKKIDIVTEFPKGDIMIIADKDRMEQVFINLINNAVKYTLEEGVVTVKVKKNLMDIEINIEDTGVGMSKDALGRIYDRFFRADRSRSIRGNGLGLSIVKRIVDLHKFKISVESQEEVGTIFTITIPQEKGLRISK